MRVWIPVLVVATMALFAGAPAQAQSLQSQVVSLQSKIDDLHSSLAPFSGEPVPGLRGFNVVLVQGDLKTSTSSDSVPAAAAKALADLKQFLPYKSYRLLDTQWTMGSGHLTSRLRGPENRDYDLELVTHKGASPDAPVAVSRFWLRDSDANALVAGAQAQRTPDLGRTNPFAWALGARAMIDTSFSMGLGETVVVGTSRLQGDTALVVLLTAVARDSSPRGGR
jgi:hypothetical protein